MLKSVFARFTYTARLEAEIKNGSRAVRSPLGDAMSNTDQKKLKRQIDRVSIENAIDRQWPDADPTYKLLVYRRWTELYDIPAKQAVKAINDGFSSPASAMRAHVIKNKKYLGWAQ
jgi:hypothetical protein